MSNRASALALLLASTAIVTACHCTSGNRPARQAEPPPPSTAPAPATAPPPATGTSAPAPAPAPTPTPAPGQPAAPSTAAPSPEPTAAPPIERPAPAADNHCTKDSDCVIAEGLSCCGDCPPVPPFRAVSRAAYAEVRKRSEQSCAVKDMDCSRHHCPTPPRGCRASAMCEAGVCAAHASASCTH